MSDYIKQLESHVVSLENKIEELCKCIKMYQSDETYNLTQASRHGELDAVKMHLEFGADIHEDDDYALALASRNGHLAVVKLLIEHGADIHANSGRAVRQASQEGHLEVVKYLIEMGADIHAEDNSLEF